MADERPTDIDGAAARCDPEWCNLRDEAALIAKGVTFRTASRGLAATTFGAMVATRGRR